MLKSFHCLSFYILLPTTLAFGEQLTSDVINSGRPEKPNIVLILTDDLGWQDVKCYDVDKPTPMETPNIDKLAAKGVKFWQAYSPAPTCAPTRCAIMSGQHPARAQKTHVVGGHPPIPSNTDKSTMIAPWYRGSMPVETYTLAKALKDGGYTTGHVGKWHMAIDHNAFPNAKDQGFEYSYKDLGVTKKMQPDRLSDFATSDPNDKFRLDANGFPHDQTTSDALGFIDQSKASPFFLYYATWLVHTPIHIRSEALLDKYCKKLGVERPTDPAKWEEKGQNNPYYCAMVESLDYYVGQVIEHLETTEDPRWKGHKLIENTYIVFTSDNGGMEAVPGEIITDNFPLDRGKISLMEGGTRVPLIITGPAIPKAVESDVMVNGLDFYPTFLTWAGIEKKKDSLLDGSNLSTLLKEDPTKQALVKNADGTVRDTMIWHFPNSVALESTIRKDGYKLILNYNYLYSTEDQVELYHLYDYKGDKATRVDIEEKHNLAATKPKLTAALKSELEQRLIEMKASYPYYNPNRTRKLKFSENIPTVESYQIEGNQLTIQFKEHGAKVTTASLLYTLNGQQIYEEWFKAEADTVTDDTCFFTIPAGSTHLFVNLVDSNNFLVTYPQLPNSSKITKKYHYSTDAIKMP
ncbi:sulfatase [Akkermansiaceae bacterium]|nr:sulfatase [Akkermansiaceae bacterium]